MIDIQNKITNTVQKTNVKININVIVTRIIKTVFSKDVRYSKEVREYM